MVSRPHHRRSSTNGVDARLVLSRRYYYIFLFWVYGIVSFILDMKTIFVLGVYGILAECHDVTEQAEKGDVRDEKERQLYYESLCDFVRYPILKSRNCIRK